MGESIEMRGSIETGGAGWGDWGIHRVGGRGAWRMGGSIRSRCLWGPKDGLEDEGGL